MAFNLFLQNLVTAISNDQPLDSKKIKDSLGKLWHLIPFTLLIVFLVLLILYSLYGTFRKATTFNVSAITEEVSIETHKEPMSPWPVKDIQLSKSCPDEPADLKMEKFTGTIKLRAETVVTLTRIAEGDLSVKLLGKNQQPTGELFDLEDESVGLLSDCAFFKIDNIDARSKQGETIVLPVTGDITAGRDIRFLTNYKTPVLLSGNVTILDKTLLVNENYSVGPFELELGDTFVIKKPEVVSRGFVRVNAEPAINLVFRAKGERALIKRYQSESFELVNSIWSKLYQDKALSIAWVLVVLLLGAIRIHLRIMSKG